MLGRFVMLAVLAAVAAPPIALSQNASPKMIACHTEATQRYIADFRQIGIPQNDLVDGRARVTSFVNDKSRYEAYLAECLARWNSTKAH